MVVRRVEPGGAGRHPDGRRFLGFEHITLVPFQVHDLAVVELLSPSEIAWVNAYHAQCEEALAHMLSGEVLGWLRKACRPLVAHEGA